MSCEDNLDRAGRSRVSGPGDDAKHGWTFACPGATLPQSSVFLPCGAVGTRWGWHAGWWRAEELLQMFLVGTSPRGSPREGGFGDFGESCLWLTPTNHKGLWAGSQSWTWWIRKPRKSQGTGLAVVAWAGCRGGWSILPLGRELFLIWTALGAIAVLTGFCGYKIGSCPVVSEKDGHPFIQYLFYIYNIGIFAEIEGQGIATAAVFPP